MPTATYEKISAVNLTSNAATISFTAIPQTYTDLRITMCSKLDVANDTVNIQFNGNTSSIYDQMLFYDNGGTQASGLNTNNSSFGFPQGANGKNYPTFTTGDIMNYTSSSFQKTLLTTAGCVDGSTRGLTVEMGRFKSTAAITSILLYANSGNFVANTKCTLYGILKA